MEYAVAESHWELVPNYPDDDLGYAPTDKGTEPWKDRWGCGTASLAAIVMYEKVRHSGEYGEEYWPYTPKYETGWGELTEGHPFDHVANDKLQESENFREGGFI